MSFPKGFLIGAATAAHQVEGNNVHSDYWAMEQLPHSSFTERSGIACDHYSRYEEDIRLMAKAGLNTYRFSVEWARIEPEEGQFDEEAIEHYRRVILCCREHGIEPLVTLMHFTSPLWLIRRGGWEAESTIGYFRRYASYVVEKLGDQLSYICTINEANMGLQLAAIANRFRLMAQQAQERTQQAQEKAQEASESANAMSADTSASAGSADTRSKESADAMGADSASARSAKSAEGTVQVGMNFAKMMENMKYAAVENAGVFGTPQPQIFVSSRTEQGDALVFRAHQAAKEAIKLLCPHIQVGITLSLHDLQALPGGEAFANKAWDEEFRHYLPFIQDDDFLGVQNYTRTLYGPQGQLPCPAGAELTQMDYEFYPEALEHVIRKVSEDFRGSLIVTENGVAAADDSRRVVFIRKALEGVERCINDGIPIKGYCHWSLMDNFEWQKGYAMTFGLIAVNRETMERTPKESLAVLGSYTHG